MSMRISVEQLNGETLVLEVTPEMRMREVKQQIKDMQTWEDELSRDTTFVEVIFGNKKLGHDETVAEVGLSEDSVVTGLLRQNIARCSSKGGIGPDIDPETLVIVEIPDSETEVGKSAFAFSKGVAKVIIPSSVSHIRDFAFQWCGALRVVTIPDSVTHIGWAAFHGCSQLTMTAPARLLRPDVSGGCKAIMARECGCGECDYRRFQHGLVCPKYTGSSLQCCEKSVSMSFLSARLC